MTFTNDNRPYQNNKIYPKTDELFPGEAEERQRSESLMMMQTQ